MPSRITFSPRMTTAIDMGLEVWVSPKRATAAVAAFCSPPIQRAFTSRRARRACCRHPGVLACKSSGDKEDDDIDDVETDTVLSRRVFVAGITATGIFTAAEGAQLFFGDRYKDKLLAPVKRAVPSLFPNEQELEPAARAPLDAQFASFYYDEHARIAANMRLVSAAELAKQEDDILTRSRSLFFTADKSLSDRDEFNYRLYARVHAIAVHTSPQQRVKFSRALGESMFKRLAATCPLPDPKPARRDLSGLQATDDLLAALRIVLAQLQANGWVTGSRIDELDSLMLADERRGELSVTCDDVFTLPTAMLIGEEEYEEASPKVSGMLIAVLAHYGCRDISSEDYYLDTVYRPDASKFKPTQLVTQINFTCA